MNPLPIAALILPLLTLSATADAADGALSCEGEETAARLASAPRGAKRLGPHRLRVFWAGGRADFVDRPPYDEPLDGLRWSYCGFDVRSGRHLIGKQDGSLFTGVLLNHADGARAEAGHTVLFAPGLAFYFAARQPDGMDGQLWSVHEAGGEVRWSGSSGLTDAAGTAFVAVFETPAWVGPDALGVDYQCVDGASPDRGRSRLTRDDGGRWSWSPAVRCPGGR